MVEKEYNGAGTFPYILNLFNVQPLVVRNCRPVETDVFNAANVKHGTRIHE